MILLTLVTIAVFLICVHLLLNYNAKARIIRKMPGPADLFIVGNMFTYIASPLAIFNINRVFAKKWSIYRFWAFPIGAINITAPDDIEAILSTTKHNEKSILYSHLSTWLREGLLLSKGSKWHQRRKILTPSFHFNILRNFCTTIQENTLRLLETLESTSCEKVDIVPLISDLTLNSICETAMGTQLSDEMADAGKSYKAAIHELGYCVITRMTRIFLYPDFIFNMTSLSKRRNKNLKIVHDYTKKVIKERKEYVEKNGYNFYESTENFGDDMYLNKKRKKAAMLDLLLLAQKDDLIDDAGIQEEVDTFMFEGHDTTASGLIYCLMLLANHEDAQEKIFQELNEVLGDTKRPVTMEDLSKLQYLERCIKESLRLYPPVPFIGRTLAEDVTLGNYTIPSGTYCHVHIYDLHRREDLYPDPMKFDPDRFLPENCAGRHPFAYIPFSAGPRNCIGQRFALLEMKLAVTAIVRQFKLAPITRPHHLRLISDLVLRNSDPIHVCFIRRNE